MTEEELREELFNLRLQAEFLKKEFIKLKNPEEIKEYQEKLIELQDNIKQVRKNIAKVKMNKVIEEKQGGKVK